MTNNKTFDTISLTNQELSVVPMKEETEMLRATDKLPLYIADFLRRMHWLAIATAKNRK